MFPTIRLAGAWGIRSFPNFLCFYVEVLLLYFTPLSQFAGRTWYDTLRSFIHEVGATVEYILDDLPVMDETSDILNLLAQGYCLDSWIWVDRVSTHSDRLMTKTVYLATPPKPIQTL